MSDLNSVLVEGSLVNLSNNSDISQDFVLSSKRIYKKNDETVEDVCDFVIRAYKALAELVKKEDPGRQMRIVGRLCQEKNPEGLTFTYIAAEHIEFRPNFRK